MKFKILFIQFIALFLFSCNENTYLLTDTPHFSLPEKIVVTLSPYTSVDEAISASDSIDWNNDKKEAQAITLAYAAKELKDHLALLNIDVKIITPEIISESNNIVLSLQGDIYSHDLQKVTDVEFESLGEEGYNIQKINGNLYVLAKERVGALYGTYGLLEHIGFRWYDHKQITQPKFWNVNAQ